MAQHNYSIFICSTLTQDSMGKFRSEFKKALESKWKVSQSFLLKKQLTLDSLIVLASWSFSLPLATVETQGLLRLHINRGWFYDI